jgi:transposase
MKDLTLTLLRQLKEENRKLKMEREILKKATVFFAKETK